MAQRYIYEDGWEFFVNKGERPTWEELKAYCKPGNGELPTIYPMWNTYRRTGTTEMREYTPGEDMTGITVSEEAASKGHPMQGDMIARDPNNHGDQWLVTKTFFDSTGFELVPATADAETGA